MQKLWISETRRNLICVDSYEDGVLKGWLCSPLFGEIQFNSLSQFLLRMEEALEGAKEPQAYTECRKFSEVPDPSWDQWNLAGRRRGKMATFELNVLFRQHSSWQGILQWREKKMEQSFRSVLELVMLMDSALRGE